MGFGPSVESRTRRLALSGLMWCNGTSSGGRIRTVDERADSDEVEVRSTEWALVGGRLAGRNSVEGVW